MLQTPGSVQTFQKIANGLEIQGSAGRMRIVLLKDGLSRIQITPKNEFLKKRSWDTAKDDGEFAGLDFALTDTASQIVLAAKSVVIAIEKSNCQVTCKSADGQVFADDLCAAQCQKVVLAKTKIPHSPSENRVPDTAATEISIKKRMQPGEGYFGFGQRAWLLDRRGSKATNWTIDPPFGHGRNHDNLYQTHPVFMALRKGFAWGMFLHSSWYSRFDIGNTNWDELEIATHSGELDYYLLHGRTPAEFTETLTLLTGRPFMPPLWALGYHQSRWGYESESEFRELATQFRKRNIGIDVLHFDIDYMRGYRCFTWDPKRFTDPKKLISDLKEQKIRVVTIVDPGIKHEFGAGYAAAEELACGGMYVKDRFHSPYIGNVWPDRVMFPDFAREDTRLWWGAKHKEHVDFGVAGIWNDMNEPANFNQPFSEATDLRQEPLPLDLRQGTDAEPVFHAEVHNLYGTHMARATAEGMRKLRPEERPWILTRSAFTGIQSHAAAWMGDNNSWWEHLELSLPQLMSMGLCGLPHVGVDIGGFWDNCNPELFARWIELGTFYPFMRTHTSKETNRQEPWSFGPDVEKTAREAIELRYQLLPYLYTLAHAAHKTGAPMLRPMLFDFPEDELNWRRDDQAMLGADILVAPICRPGQYQRMCYLPEGDWYHYWTGRHYAGNQSIVIDAPMGKTPFFLRGGAVLPFGNIRSSSMEPLTTLCLHVQPGSARESHFIEDDGHTFAFEKGETSKTRISFSQTATQLKIELHAREGNFTPPPRQLSWLIALAQKPQTITVDGKPASVVWHPETFRAEVSWADDARAHVILVTI